MSKLTNIAKRLGMTQSTRGLIAFACAAYSGGALAGDMDGVGYFFVAIGIGCCLVVVASIVAFIACRKIEGRTLRALTRLAIVVLVYTPIPLPQGTGRVMFVPAFYAAIPDFIGTAQRGHGLFAHPQLLAYAVAFTLFAPLLLAWLALEKRYGRR